MLKKLLVLLFIPLIFCSCTKNNVEEISFSSWGSITETQILKKIISDFENTNPEVKVNFIHIPQNYFQKIHLLFASSQAPDVIFINNLYLPIYAEQLEPINNISFKDYYPQSIEALSYNNSLLAIPRDISNLVIYYNKDLLKNSVSDLTFDNFDRNIKNYYGKGLYGISYEKDIYWARPYILTLGFDKGINYYKTLEGKYAPKPAQVGSSTLAQMFLDKKIVFYLSGRWMYPKISESADFNFGISTFPGIVDADVSGWAISKNSKHKESAQKFINFLSTKENIEYMTQTGLIVPARIDAAQRLNNPKEKVFLDAIQKSVPHKTDKNYKKEVDRLNKEIFH